MAEMEYKNNVSKPERNGRAGVTIHDQQRAFPGYTLICAMNWGETGRVFEVTPAGETVWEFWNPEEDSIYRSARYEVSIVDPLLSSG